MALEHTGGHRAIGSCLCLIAILLSACASDDPATRDARVTTSSSAETTSTQPTGPVGPIAFQRADPKVRPGEEGGEEADLYAVDIDGTNEQRLFTGPAQLGRWSPDGTELAIFCCDNGMVAHLLNVATRELREFPEPDPKLETHCGFAWSPDGERLACEVFGNDDSSLNGIYTIRTSDGRDLSRITTNPGGDDIPGDYSPDGTRMVFIRLEDDTPVGYFVTNVDGSGMRQSTPDAMILDDSGFGADGHPTVLTSSSSAASPRTDTRPSGSSTQPTASQSSSR